MTANSTEASRGRPRSAGPSRRRCLCCGLSFASAGAHERVCPRCKEGEDWLAGAVEHPCHAGDGPAPSDRTG